MKFEVNNYRYKKFGNNYLVTTDHGSYQILSEKEFQQLQSRQITEKLAKKLEQAEIVFRNKDYGEAVRLMNSHYGYLFSGTALHIIVVTLRCNMNCIYCHASSKPVTQEKYDMDKITAKHSVDRIFESPNNSIRIEFQGGEPLLNWEVVKYVIEYAEKKNSVKKKDLKFSLVTNLSLMDKTKMEYLIDHDIEVCSSLDGPKELHDHNRKYFHGSNYDQVVKWIKVFNQEYKMRKINMGMSALVTLTRKSLGYSKEIVDEYIRLGLRKIHLRFLNNLGVANKTWDSINYSVQEYMEFWKNAVIYIEKKKQSGIDISERMVEIMLQKFFSDQDPNYLELRSPCGAAIGQLAYNYDGKVYSCDEARMIDDEIFMLGNVRVDKYKEIVSCDKACALVNASINDQYICDSCVYKPYCGICPVCNYAEQGTIVGKIPQTIRCKIYKQQFDWVVKEKLIKKDISNN